ncbi:MAG: hypothetical protein EBS90_12770 [Betaproteobacteria bacterium]|nr:hypothetical protein [Betaproteobacteria bacterium]
MWDESGEFEEIVCPFCDTKIEQGCEHVLLHVDVTFGQCIDGAAQQMETQIGDRITEAFQGHLIAGRNPQWCHHEMQELWDNIRIGYEGNPASLPIGGSAFYRVFFSLLDEAGGYEYHGNLVSRSGAYCESSVRLMYAENPAEVCVKALSILHTYLLAEEPTQRPPKRRKGSK